MNNIQKILIIDSDYQFREALLFSLKNKLPQMLILEYSSINKFLKEDICVDDIQYIITDFYTVQGNVLDLLEYLDNKKFKNNIIIYTQHTLEGDNLQFKYFRLKIHIINKFDYSSLIKVLGIENVNDLKMEIIEKDKIDKDFNTLSDN